MYFSFRDDESLCLRHGYNIYCRTQVFAFCQRYDCPDAVRCRQVDSDHPYGEGPLHEPTCVVNKCMLKLISCVLSHVLRMKRIVEEEDDGTDYGLDVLSCERFLGIGWQAPFLKKFCVQLDHGEAGNAAQDLIALDEDVQNLMARPDPRYRQAHASDIVLVADNRDLDLSQVLSAGSEFRMSDVSHTM